LQRIKLASPAIVTLCLCYGCASNSITFRDHPPQVPKPPIVLLTDVDDARAAVVTDVADRSVLWEGSLPGKGKTLAILPVSGPDTSGDLLTAITTVELKKAGVKVVERQVTEAIRDEIDMLDFFHLPTADALNRMGQLLAADYFLVAAVTTVDTNLVQVHLPARKFDPDDLPRYASEYMRWKRGALAYLDRMSEAADIFRIKPAFDESDQYDAYLLRNAIAKVRRDIEDTDFIGIQAEQPKIARPALVAPDFFNREEREKADTRAAAPEKTKEPDWSVVSPYGPYSGGGYRPLLRHVAEELPKSPRRVQFEWQQGRHVTFNVRQTNASVAFRLVNATTGEYVGLGVFEVDDNSEPKAIERLAERVAEVVAEKF
jgi:hypothetical protein